MATQVTVYTVHGIEPRKLARVTEEMRTLGAPTVRVVDCGDYMQAIEGTHRLHAAAELGIAPRLVVLAQGDLVDGDSLDWQDLQPGERYTAGELAGEAHSFASRAIRFPAWRSA